MEGKLLTGFHTIINMLYCGIHVECTLAMIGVTSMILTPAPSKINF